MTQPPADQHAEASSGASAVPHVVVVGAGVSGLTAAWEVRQQLGRGVRITVLEASGSVGGHLRVAELAGLPVDVGAESVLARRPEGVDLIRAVGLGADLGHPAPVGARLLSGAALRPLPAGTVMGVPGDLDRLADDGVFSPDEVAAMWRRDVAREPTTTDVSVGELVGERLGRVVVDRLVEPLLGGVYAGRADVLSLQATMPALATALTHGGRLVDAVRSVAGAGTGRAGGGGPVFAGLDGGIGRLPGALVAAAEATVRRNTTVRELRRTPTGWSLVTGPRPRPKEVVADAVVLAVPAAAASRLLTPVAPGAATGLAAVETASTALVSMALPAGSFAALPAISGYLVAAGEGTTAKAVTLSSVKWPWLRARAQAEGLEVLRASVGRHREVEALQVDDEDLVAGVAADLRALGVTAAPVRARVDRWGGALPQYGVGHLDLVARVRAAVEGLPNLAVCGAVYDGVGIPACVAAARRAGAEVAAGLRSARVRIDP